MRPYGCLHTHRPSNLQAVSHATSPKPNAKLADIHTQASGASSIASGPVSLRAHPAAPRTPVERVQLGSSTITLARAAHFAPVVLFHPDEAYLPCSAETMLARGTLLDAQGITIKEDPSQEDLAEHADDGARLAIRCSQYFGEAVGHDQRIRAPMYVSAQRDAAGAHIDLHYVFLFAYNGPQTARVRIPGQSYDCLLPHFAEHQGDIEGVTVRVTPDLRSIVHVKVENHGRPSVFAPNAFDFEGSHPVVRCAYNSHATYNAKGCASEKRFATDRYTGLGFGVEFIDLTSQDGPRWAPFETDAQGCAQPNGQLVFVGLDKADKPIGNQPWAAFRGKLGARWTNTYQGATGIAGRPLSRVQKSYADALAHTAIACGAVKKRSDSNGTDGLGVRKFIHGEP